MNEYEFIMNDLHKKLDWLNENKNYDVFGLFLKGSQNYAMSVYSDAYTSDIDAIAIIIPSLDNVVRNDPMVSKTYVMEDNSHIDVKDIRMIKDMFVKANPSFLEILFTKYFVTKYNDSNKYYEYYLHDLHNISSDIAAMNKDKLLSCIKGTIYQKRKNLCLSRPSTADDIAKWRYVPKELSHMYRMLYMANKLCKGYSFEQTLVPEDPIRQFIIDVKTKPELMPYDDAVVCADAIVETVDGYIEDYRNENGREELNNKTLDLLNDLVYGIIKDKIGCEVMSATQAKLCKIM